MKTSVYFPNLNGLRFLAAFMVLIHHVELLKQVFGLKNNFSNLSVLVIGKLGVILFFVLSGFLITYLLLQEKKDTGTVSVKQFYLRRMLRIWPLYFLVVAGGLFLFPQIQFLFIPEWTPSIHEHFGTKILLFLFFLPNLAITLFTPVSYASISWSVGVEEQFYLVWPWLIKKFRQPLRMLIGVILFYLLVRAGLILVQKFVYQEKGIEYLLEFWRTYFNIDCMAIGGIAAWILFMKKEKIMRFLFNPFLQAGVYLLTVFLLLIGFYFPVYFFHYEFYAVLFAVIMLNLAGNKKALVSLENPVLSYLGKISYGLYMYHLFAIVICIKLLQPVFPDNSFILYPASILLTIFIAGLSYEIFEKRFILAKKRFSTVISGDNAKS